MNILIQCDQTECTWNKDKYIPPWGIQHTCKHSHPALYITFGEELSDKRICHSMERKDINKTIFK